MSGRIVICGAVAQKPNQAGHTWQFLQYLLGFQELGFDVLLVDRLRGPVERTDRRVAYVREVMRGVGLDQAWTIGLDDGSPHRPPARRRPRLGARAPTFS